VSRKNKPSKKKTRDDEQDALAGESLVKELAVPPGGRVDLQDENASRTFGWEKDKGVHAFERNRERLADLQHLLYADGRYGVLVVLQATDGGGKDSTVRDVFTSMNPQGVSVTSFKAPTSEELKHDYLWRIHHFVPARGMLGVFNRSHYEDVLVVRVEKLVDEEVWEKRYDHINDFERMLKDNNIVVIKLFLQISKDEQKKRFEERLADPTKHWKFNADDIAKRKHWDAYQEAFAAMFEKCSTDHAPWYVIPADRKWLRNLAVSEILVNELGKLPLRFPPTDIDPSKIRIR
jgi:PPK2 family polyphosphate:nucleotide phosphotransferase